MISKLKENIHFVILTNILITFFVLVTDSSGPPVNLIVINGEHNKSTKKELKKVICQKALYSIQDQSLSDYFIHPEIIDAIKTEEYKDFDLSKIEKFYFEIKGREICKIIGRTSEGFVAFEGVIAKDGPLMFRLTSIHSIKPSFTDIKELL